MRIRDAMFPLLLAAGLVACGKDEKKPSTPAAGPGASPAAPSGGGLPMTPEAGKHEDHDAKHGGELLELGEHEGHLEIVHDEKTGTLTAYVYDGEMKPVSSEAPTINLTKGGLQVSMTPVSGSGPKADAWKATHDALKVEPLEGRVRLKIGDKTFQASLAHEHK